MVPFFELAVPVIAICALYIFDGNAVGMVTLLGCLLLTAAAIDQRTMLLPDSLTGAALLLGLVMAAMTGPAALLAAIMGAAVGFAAFFVIGRLFAHLRRQDGLGLGDAKLLAAAGAWVGWQALPSLVLVAACTAILAMLSTTLVAGGNLRRRLPFGPHLAFAAWLTLLYRPMA